MLSLPPRRSGPPRQPVCDGPCCLHLHGCRLGLRSYHFRGHLCVRLRYGLATRPHPTDEAVERLQKVGFPSPCAPSYRALAFPLVGLPPTEHASLRWTHNRACAFPFTRLLSGAAPVMSTIEPTGLGDALSALHTSLGQAGFRSSACLLAPLPSTPPLPRQPILGMTPGLRFLGDPSSTSACG